MPLPSQSRFCKAVLCLWLVVTTPWLRADLQRQANTTLSLPAILPYTPTYTTQNAIPVAGVSAGMTFASPVCTAFPAGETNRLYVAQLGGSVRVVNNLSSSLPTQAVFMDLATYLSTQNTPLAGGGENGLLSMVFHPNYNQNGYFYLYYSIIVSGQLHQRLARFRATGTAVHYNAATAADPATQAPLLTLYDEASNHNGGDLAFGADGYLYLSLGDEGNGGDYFNNARFINKDFWGQLLRLDVDSKSANLIPNPHAQPGSTSHPSAVHAGTFRVPADNPFIGATSWHGRTIAANTVRTEIYATGFRNPFRFNIDAPTGRFFLGDVGQGSWEEVDLVVKGGDYGWSWREGRHAYRESSTIPPRYPDNSAGNTNVAPATGFTPIDPIFEYGHDSSTNIYGSSVIGGLIYRGSQLPELQGAYLFADVYGAGGMIGVLRETSPGVWSGQRMALCPQIVDFGTDPRNGEPLLCGLGGTIYKLVRTGPLGTEPPALLSQTGAFSDLASLTPAAGVVPYEPNVSFWSDYALKSRWFAIKNPATKIQYSPAANWAFPTGMVWVKHFDFEVTRGDSTSRRKLETRFLVKTDSGVYGISYKWRADQSDADLVAESGLTENIAASNPAQTWRYPSRGDCLTCHTQGGGYALSFNTPQMNRTYTYGGAEQNQILALSKAGYLTSAVTSTQDLPAFATATDATQSLEWRVRSYLAVNCAQCHQPGGGAQGFWDARYATATDQANLINGPLVTNGGSSANRVLAPGDAMHSMLLKRQQGIEAARMPPLATNERDLINEQLLMDWIAALPQRQSLAQWQTAFFGSPNAAKAAAGLDPDSDGRTNFFEYLTGTLPTDTSRQWNFGPVEITDGTVKIPFVQPANCAAVVEVSSDLKTWQPWTASDNFRNYPATHVQRVIIAPADGANRFFRVRMSAP